MNDEHEEDYAAAREGAVGADRMSLHLPIIPDPVRGDMDKVAKLSRLAVMCWCDLILLKMAVHEDYQKVLQMTPPDKMALMELSVTVGVSKWMDGKAVAA